jgi:hypothetical protein
LRTGLRDVKPQQYAEHEHHAAHFFEHRQEQRGHFSLGRAEKDSHDEGLLGKDQQQASQSG